MKKSRFTTKQVPIDPDEDLLLFPNNRSYAESKDIEGRKQFFDQVKGMPTLINTHIPQPTPEEAMIFLRETGIMFVEDKTEIKPLQGQDIIDIRLLTGKKRDNAMKALYVATEDMLATADKDCFFIRGNVASSKNSKNIVTVKNINKKTGKPQEFSTPVPSDLVREYIRDTKGAWLQNKVAFLNQTRHLPLPLRIEFTFIRESLRAFDHINALQVICDLMGGKNGYGYILDDETSHIMPVFNTVYYHKELAGVLIRVIK